MTTIIMTLPPGFRRTAHVTTAACQSNRACQLEKDPATLTRTVGPTTRPSLALWRTLPPDAFTHVVVTELDLLLAPTALLHAPRWQAARRGDAAAAISLALAALPLTPITARTDLVMTALCLCALNGSAAATLVLAHVLRRLGDPHQGQLASTWLAHPQRLPRRHQASALNRISGDAA